MRLLILALALPLFAAEPVFESQFIFAPQSLHSHSSSIVELPNGDLYTVWYIGSGERRADDVKLEAARFRKGAKQWSERYTVADTPGFPDCNPIVFVDAKKRLMMMWPVILDNNWESALIVNRISNQGWKSDPVAWSDTSNILLIPRNLESRLQAGIKSLLPQMQPGRDLQEAQNALERSSNKLYNRLGWMPRVHPIQLPSGRLLVPLYTDTYNMSLIAISDDHGATWTTSEPMVSLGGVQPALVRKRDGTIIAYMRDNGPPPQRVLVAESKDDGMNWSEVKDSDIPNPGSSVDVVGLRDGSWAMVNNDTEKGRNRLSVWISEDEGRTWPHRRAIEDHASGGFSYPSVIQDSAGFIHVTYSHSAKPQAGGKDLQTIKHVRFNAEWVKQR